MVLAIGSLMNTSLPAYNRDAEKYHQLARAALFNTTIFDEPTINAVQALVRDIFLFIYLTQAETHTVLDGVLSLLGRSTWDELGSSLGYHGYRRKGRTERKPCHL